MSAVAILDCPHCNTQKVAFTSIGEWMPTDRSRRALFRCGACGEGLIAEYWGTNSLRELAGDISQWSVSLGRRWPEPVNGDAPEDTPATIANFFQQGTSSLTSGNFDAAGMMFRKALESATKHLDAESAKLTLVKRIDKLVEKGALTQEMGTWAHEVRLGGNEAAHEDEPFTKEEAQDLRNFIENFLRYAFTLPSAVRRRSNPEPEAS